VPGRRKHRWSGWPGAWCLDCGLEDARELEAAGPVEEVHHRYSVTPHTVEPCAGCSTDELGCQPWVLRRAPDADRWGPMEADRLGAIARGLA